MIYLDCNSTTPIDPRVLEAMTAAWRDYPGNPASQHGIGRRAHRRLEESREAILDLLGAKTGGMDGDQLIFTSGGTEANNLALLGSMPEVGDGYLFTSPFEHPSIRMPAELWRKRGLSVKALPWSEEFWRAIIPEQEWLEGALVVSFMLANNETGEIFDVRDVVETCGPYGAEVHTDAVQAVGKIAVNFRQLGVDGMTVAPHKFHGPLGIGGLVLKHRVKLRPLLFGGFQQGSLRPGTEGVALAVGFEEALRIAVGDLTTRAARMRELRDELELRLKSELPEMVIIGEASPRLPNTSCVSFPGIDRQALIMALDLAGVACSTGSACASGSSEPSPTLLAMGLAKALVDSAIRLSLGAFTTAAEVTEGARRIVNTVKHLRGAK